MKRLIFSGIICAVSVLTTIAADPSAAERYQREAEYYQRQAESCQRDAESYMREAKSHIREAGYYLRNKNYDRARDYYRKAANSMDWYETKIKSAERAASNSEDYLKRAADALR
ncbi:MAG: hypothetical protein K2L73_02845 [Muribaculaceae bacterium]|nr:hypothetical protein [Muribaculaceae bacterium]